MFDTSQVLFCAEECEKQKVGPMAVFQMFRAFNLARSQSVMTYQFILDLGLLVDPRKNKNGLRQINITFHNQVQPAIHHELIQDQLTKIIIAYHDDQLTIDEFYRQFEIIHPFIDGNGRVGVILWNFLQGILENPTPAPDMF